MEYLKLIDILDPTDPSDGNPYVYHNRDVNKTWIFMDFGWILDDGFWNMGKYWKSDGVWNY